MAEYISIQCIFSIVIYIIYVNNILVMIAYMIISHVSCVQMFN